ncbi:MAG: hypothetical protein IPN33_08585 [Saprospiraceae bacterium]|nr:hypothetical protein [Saprospiraceae bacterium]
MKKQIISIAILFCIAIVNMQAQQWSGLNNTTGNIIRSGNVGINVASPTKKLHVGGGLRVENEVSVGGAYVFEVDAPGIYGGRFKINTNGNVGINTPNPTAKFEVNLLNNNGWAGNSKAARFLSPDNNFFMDLNTYVVESGNVGYQFSPNNTIGMCITTQGKVGINESNPTLKFQVNGGDGLALGLGGSGTGEGFGSRRSEGENRFGLDFYAAFEKRMSITQGGKVGIGINNPDQMPGNYLLYVAQGIMTEKVKVALRSTGDWADYVFADGYQLRSLEEVEQFVKENKHLPGVPSAEEVHQSGIDVAAMDAKLLEKIEELTLYMIELKKENQALRQEVEEIRKMQK